MKIAVILIDGAKQIMMTPESDHEKQALKMIAPGDKLNVVTKWGSFSDEHNHANLQVDMCKGNYLRVFSEAESLMFVIRDKQKEATQ